MKNYLILLIVVSIVLSSCRKKAIKVNPAFKGIWWSGEMVIGDDIPDKIEINDGIEVSHFYNLASNQQFESSYTGYAKITKHNELKIGQKIMKIELYPTSINDTVISKDIISEPQNYMMKLDGIFFYKNDFYD